MPRRDAWGCGSAGDGAGSRQRSTPAMSAHAASMRPGLLCPGKRRWGGSASRICHGFNEAGAVMPRKAPMPKPPDCIVRSFNEAGAVMPRKAAYLFRREDALALASMRPGLLCPGKDGHLADHAIDGSGFNEAGAVMPRKVGVGAGAHRQLFHRFNEAGAVMPRKGARPPTLPGRSGRFNEAGAVMPRKDGAQRRRRVRQVRASMRPGLLCPGKIEALRAWLARPPASMRPGLLCPGKAVRLGPGAGARELLQ